MDVAFLEYEKNSTTFEENKWFEQYLNQWNIAINRKVNAKYLEN